MKHEPQSIVATLTTSERLAPFAIGVPDNDPLPARNRRRLFCLINDDGSFEDIDPITSHTVEAGWLPTVGRKDAA